MVQDLKTKLARYLHVNLELPKIYFNLYFEFLEALRLGYSLNLIIQCWRRSSQDTAILHAGHHALCNLRSFLRHPRDSKHALVGNDLGALQLISQHLNDPTTDHFARAQSSNLHSRAVEKLKQIASATSMRTTSVEPELTLQPLALTTERFNELLISYLIIVGWDALILLNRQ